ncbi:MAG: CHAT domain-containing protein [Pirellulales bacterium]
MSTCRFGRLSWMLGLCAFAALAFPGIGRAQNNAAPPAQGGGNTVKGVPLLGPNAAVATRNVPGADYYLARAVYYNGDFASARRNFVDVSRGGIKGFDGARWIDSICYHSMLGECHYQLGDLAASLEQHNSALALYMSHLSWMLRIEFPDAPGVLTKVDRPPTWGASSRNSVLGRYPETLRSLQGQSDAANQAAIQQGGILAQAQLSPVGAMEVLRCIAVSLHRRAEILGPAGAHDPFTQTLIDGISRRPAPANHWSQCFIDLQLGLAYVAAGKPAQAASELQKSLLAGGQFEHPMTCLALLNLGKIALATGQFDNAMAAFTEATFSASVYGQWDVLEEAFRGAVSTHLIRGNKTFLAALAPAVDWAQRSSINLEASLLVLSAENLLAIGETQRAMGLLTRARAVLGRHEALAGQIGARYHYELAKAHFQAGNLSAGSPALATAMAFQSKGSRRLFQIAYSDNLYTQGILSERLADALYADVLREPQPNDWNTEPMETLSVVMTPKMLPMEHWFEVAMKRNEPERACEIVDRIRRQKFFGSLPLGGRLHALRWVLSAPAEALGDRANLQRRDILAKYPGFAELEQKSAALRAQIAAEPLAIDDPDAQKEQAGRYDQLLKLSAAQELILHDMAVQRVPADYAFPPTVAVRDVQAKLAEQSLILAYFNGTRGLYGFAITKDKYAAFKLDAPNKLRADLVDLLKRLGLRDRNQAIETKDLKDDSWQPIAARLLDALANGTKPEAWDKYREVIIVPDGLLWYCPFEMLPAGKNGEPLLTKTRVRYVPTVSLAIPDGRPTKPVARTALVAGRLYPRDDLQVAAAGAEALAGVLAETSRLPNRLPGPSSLVAKFCDRLVVYHDMEDTDKGPYDWSPVQIDQKKPLSQLASHMTLPWGGPSQMVFPGYHTPAEVGLKKGGVGDELFFSICGLMANGTRTILLSRWRVGGQTSFDLTREFVQELPHEPASEAWQRSVLLRMQSEIDAPHEPRLRLSSQDEPVRPVHPFFWAGYLLVDTGVEPPAPAAQAAK